MAEERHEQLRPQYPLDPSAYQILSEIGVGVSAVVYRAVCIPMNSAVVAIKSIDLDQARADFDSIRREAKIMSLLSHPNILKAHCCFIVDRQLWVVMPFMSGGSLQSIISSCFPDGLSEACIAIVLKETLHALSYLHDQGHLHRDIKAGNILIDANGSIKLADFGVSASIYESNYALGTSQSSSSSSLMLTEMTGTPYWMAPEVIHSRNGYSFRADIWSFGITALELAHGRPPLSHLPPSKSLLMKMTKKFRFSDYAKSSGESKNKKFTKAFKDMVALCLHQDPGRRPTAGKLLKHSLFKGCKGSDFLVKNVLHGLPSVENRFRQSKLTRLPSMSAKSDDDDEDNEGSSALGAVKQRRISGWNFNEDGFQLDPIFPSEFGNVDCIKWVRFGGETIIPRRNMNDSDDRHESCQVVCEAGNSNEGSGGDGSSGSVVASGVSSPGQVEEVNQDSRAVDDVNEDDRSLGGAVGGGGQAAVGICMERVVAGLVELRNSLDTQRQEVSELIGQLGGGGELSREEQLVQMVEQLMKELAEERMKNLELQTKLDPLKMSASQNE
ncbi:hypothetical protein Ancab_030279 [Ancistrocladus abbreviatus]